MQISERFDYTWGSHTATIEVAIVDDETVELCDVFGVRDSSDSWVDLEGSQFETLIASIEVQLELESLGGEWTPVIAATKAAAWDDALDARMDLTNPAMWS